jgi:hypothetical protein
MGNDWEVAFTIFVLALWILFPAGMFFSMSHVDKNTDQIIRLEKLRHSPTNQGNAEPQVREFKRPIALARSVR